MTELSRLYQDAIRQHAAEPVGFKSELEATHRHEIYNPQCGDRIEVLLAIQEPLVDAIGFDGEACAICMASASMMCEMVSGRRVEELLRWKDQLEQALKNEQPMDETLLQPLLGVRPYPSRIRCATLPWEAAGIATAPQLK